MSKIDEKTLNEALEVVRKIKTGESRFKSKFEQDVYSVRGEIARGTFDFYSYWREVESNVGKEMSEEEIWEELGKDLKYV